MARPTTLWTLALAAVLAAAGSWLVARRHLARGEVVLRSVRRAAARYSAVRKEHDRLLAEQPTEEETRRLAKAHSLERALRARLSELKSNPTDSEDAASADTLSAKQWAYVGNATPRAAITSVLWAASQGDVDRLSALIGLSDGERAKAAALYSQLPAASQQDYGSPEKVVATMIAGNFPKDASSATITADREWGEDASVVMSVDHGLSGSRTNLYRFRLSPEGWHLLLPEKVMDGISESLLPQAAQASPGANGAEVSPD